MKRLIAAVLVAGAWSRADVQQPAFRAGTRLVPIYATVTGRDGRLLPGLTQDQFTVLDNGKPVQITAFSNLPVPITVTALWDVSNSMRPFADRARAAARSFVEALWPDDRLRFGTFGTEVAFSPLLTSDKTQLRRIVDEEIWFGGGTPTWAAIHEALSLLSVEPGRRVLVVLGDAGSAGDPLSKRHVLDAMQRADCMIYVIGLEGSGVSGAVKDLAEQSGGGRADIDTHADLDTEFARVIAELHHQYLIGFTPHTLDGRVHSLSVRTTVRGAHVRARKEYVAPAGGRQ